MTHHQNFFRFANLRDYLLKPYISYFCFLFNKSYKKDGFKMSVRLISLILPELELEIPNVWF